MRLQEALSEEGDSLERRSLKPDDFYDSIGSVEERAEAAFKAIDRQVEEDKLLLSVEQEELRPALKKAHAEVLESLKSAVARFDQRQEKAKKEGEEEMNCLLLVSLLLGADPSAADRFSDVRIEKPFDRYLLANPLLMESTGAKVVKLPKKRSLVLAVASTVLKDNSAAERLRAEKVCRVKAFAYLGAGKEGRPGVPHGGIHGQDRHRERGRQGTREERLGVSGVDEDEGGGHRQGHAGSRALEIQGGRRVLPRHRRHRQQKGQAGGERRRQGASRPISLATTFTTKPNGVRE